MRFRQQSYFDPDKQELASEFCFLLAQSESLLSGSAANEIVK